METLPGSFLINHCLLICCIVRVLLISNTFGVVPLKKGTVQILAEQTDSSVQLEIVDSGVGMDEETKDMLFEIGKTKSKQGTKGEKGTGFGLLLCKEFVEKHNGTITVESSPNKGSRFIITLPSTLPARFSVSQQEQE